MNCLFACATSTLATGALAVGAVLWFSPAAQAEVTLDGAAQSDKIWETASGVVGESNGYDGKPVKVTGGETLQIGNQSGDVTKTYDYGDISLEGVENGASVTLSTLKVWLRAGGGSSGGRDGDPENSKLKLSSDITLNNGKIHVEDGATHFTGAITVSGGEQNQFFSKYGKGYVMNSLSGVEGSKLTFIQGNGDAELHSTVAVNGGNFDGTVRLHSNNNADFYLLVGSSDVFADAVVDTGSVTGPITGATHTYRECALVLNAANVSVGSLLGNGNIRKAPYAPNGTTNVAGSAGLSATDSATLTIKKGGDDASFTGSVYGVNVVVSDGATQAFDAATLGEGASLTIADGASATLNGLTLVSGSTLTTASGSHLSFGSALQNAGEVTIGSGTTLHLAAMDLGQSVTLTGGEGTMTIDNGVIFFVGGEQVHHTAVDTSSSPGTVTLHAVAQENAIVWQGSASSNWNATDANWQNGEVFAKYAAVTFADGEGIPKAVAVDSDVTASNMLVSGTGYTFSGEGNIHVLDTLGVEGGAKFSADVVADNVAVSASGSATILASFEAREVRNEGSVTVTGDAAARMVVTGSLVNQGSLTVGYPLQVDFSSAEVVNSGIMAIYGGDVALGHVENQAGARISIAEAIISPTGTITNHGKLTFEGGVKYDLSSLPVGETLTLLDNQAAAENIKGWGNVQFVVMDGSAARTVTDKVFLNEDKTQVALVSLDNAITWQGTDSGTWDYSSLNWMDGNSPETYTPVAFSALSSVKFGNDILELAPEEGGDSGEGSESQPLTDDMPGGVGETRELVKNIDLASNVFVSNMEVSGAGYSFNGNGTIHVSDTLNVAAGTSFGEAVSVSTPHLVVTSSEEGGTTSFNSASSVANLTLQDAPAVEGTDAIEPGKSVVNFAAAALTLDSLELTGTHFTLNVQPGAEAAAPTGALTVTGNAHIAGKGDTTIGAATFTAEQGLTVAGHEASTTTFTGAVNALGRDTVDTSTGAAALSLRAGADSLTIFKGNVEADSLYIAGCSHVGDADCDHKGGVGAAYEFRGNLTVNGEADIHLDSRQTGAAASTLLRVEGSMTSDSLTLSGSGSKLFDGVVTVNGDLSIGGVTMGDHGAALEGITTFNNQVNVHGDLVIHDHSEAVFYQTFKVDGDILLGDAVLAFEKPTSADGTVEDIGSIVLQGTNNADTKRALSFSSLTRAKADVSVAGSEKLDLSVGGSGRVVQLALNGVRHFSVSGGEVHLQNIRGGNDQVTCGQIYGDLSVSGGALLELHRAELFADGATGNISVENATLNLNGNAQTLYGNISMSNAVISGGSMTATEATNVSFMGNANYLRSALTLGTNHLTFSGSDSVTKSFGDDRLMVESNISGSGTMTISGGGIVDVMTNLDFNGDVVIEDGAGLVLHSNEALYNAKSLMVGTSSGSAGALSITHGGVGVQINATQEVITTLADGTEGKTYGDGHVILGDGARLNFADLNGHGDSAALQLKGGLYFDGSVDLTFTQPDGSQLENLRTYVLASSETAIDFTQSNTQGDAASIAVKIGNQTLDEGKYEIGFYSTASGVGATGTRYLTITMLRGSHWQGGEFAEGSTTDYDWFNGANWDHDILRDEAGNYVTDDDGRYVYNSYDILFRELKEGDSYKAEEVIQMSKASTTTGLYMDGRTNYVFVGNEAASLDMKNALIKRGEGSMTWENVQTMAAAANVEQGTLYLRDGSTLGSDGLMMVRDTFNGTSEGGTIAIDSSSALQTILKDAKSDSVTAATIRGYDSTNTKLATLHGVDIKGTTISGAAYTEHVISDAAVEGFALDTVTLQGKGSLGSFAAETADVATTLGKDVVIAEGASYELGKNVALNETVLNHGTVTVSGETTLVLGSGVQMSIEGDTTTYTLFLGTGNYQGWGSLAASHVFVNGVALSTLKDVTYRASATDGSSASVALTASDRRFTEWDAAWTNVAGESAPAISKILTPGSGEKFLVNGTDTTYRYDQLFNGESAELANTYVVTIAGSDAASNYTFFGAVAGTGEEAAPIDIWVNVEGQAYGRYIAGAATETISEGAYYYGDSHIQMNGADVSMSHPVVGGSLNVVQVGDSYLTVTAGTYTGDGRVVGGSYLGDSDGTMEDSRHEGMSHLHISGGEIANAIGGSYQTYTVGNTHVELSGGEVTNIYAGDYTTTASTHTGDVTLDLRGGKVTNVYGAGSDNATNKNKVDGDVLISLYVNDNGQMATEFATNARLWGGRDYVEANHTSTLNFADAGVYDLSSVSVKGFTNYTLARGAEVTLNGSKLEDNGTMSVSGAGSIFTLIDDKTDSSAKIKLGLNHVLNIGEGVRLNLRTGEYSAGMHGQIPSNYPTVNIAKGATLDITDSPGAATDLAMRLYLAGDGVDGKGALYKGDGNPKDEGSKVTLPYIVLTDHASVAGQSQANAGMYMTPPGNWNFAAVLDLTNGGKAEGDGYIFTKAGVNTLSLRNVDIYGGALNVVEGEVSLSYSCSGGNTDVILHEGTLLTLEKDAFGYNPRPGTAENPYANAVGTGRNDHASGEEKAQFNGFSLESLSGAGTVDLGNNGMIYLMRDLDADASNGSFSADFGTTAKEGQIYFNDAGYEYAHFSGEIVGAGRVTKAGKGTQFFTGGESTYSGETHVTDGVLYILDSDPTDDNDGSVASTFARGNTVVLKGAIGTADLVWEAGKDATGAPDSDAKGAVWLGDGVRLFNGGKAADGVRMTLGVGVDLDENENITKYHTATYSGVLRDANPGDKAIFEKVGQGTLVFDQDNQFSGGGYVTEGTLVLKGWAALDSGSLSPEEGATLMLAYDADPTYVGETTRATTDFVLQGTGDQRWANDTSVMATENHTAALISNIGVNKVLTLAGNISAGTADGNFLHCGEGHLILSGENSYTGGTVITDGTLTAQTSTALGATAEGGTAAVTLAAGAKLMVESSGASETAMVLAAANDLRGSVLVGAVNSNRRTSLTMEGSGYYASDTELAERGTLVFRGAEASNWDGDTLTGAGSLTGSGTVAVSDATGMGTQVQFTNADAETSFEGNLVAEGDNTLLRVNGGKVEGGSVSASGQNARVETDSALNFTQGTSISLRSTGAAAVVSAGGGVTVGDGGRLAVSRSATSYQYSAVRESKSSRVAVSDTFSLGEALTTYQTTEAAAATYTLADNIQEGDAAFDYDRTFLMDEALNTAVSARIEGGMSMTGGSSYSFDRSHTSLAGGSLTLAVTEASKIKLEANVGSFRSPTPDDAPYELSKQLVLFSDVQSFSATFTGLDTEATYTLQGAALAEAGATNQVYVLKALDFFEPTKMLTEKSVLVYDAGAKVVYLDGIESVPEPTTTTLGLLALAALCARRRRH